MNAVSVALGVVCVLLLLASAVSVLQARDTPAATPTREELREEEAYTIGVQAYVYGFPLVEMYKTRFAQVESPKNEQRTPPNQFHHARRLHDDTFKTVVSPNNDTLYSSAWLDLAAEPILLSVPAIKDRYYTFQ